MKSSISISWTRGVLFSTWPTRGRIENQTECQNWFRKYSAIANSTRVSSRRSHWNPNIIEACQSTHIILLTPWSVKLPTFLVLHRMVWAYINEVALYQTMWEYTAENWAVAWAPLPWFERRGWLLKTSCLTGYHVKFATCRKWYKDTYWVYAPKKVSRRGPALQGHRKWEGLIGIWLPLSDP